MDALVYHGPRDLRLERVSPPTPEPGEALVRVKGCGVCGSDLHGYLGHSRARKPPLVLGHEAAGIVEAVGSGVDRSWIGLSVAIRPTLVCGKCALCTTGRDNLCLERRLLGLNTPGALAELVAVPIQNLALVPSDLLPAAGLVEVLANAIHVMGRLGDAPSLGIAGGGCLGLLTAFAASQGGVRDCLLTEPSQERRSIARSLGATAVADPSTQTLAALAHAHLPEGVAAAVDAVGIAATRTDAVAALAPGGRLVALGLEEEMGQVDFADLIRREIELVGTFAYTGEEFRRASESFAEHAVQLEGLVSREPLERGPELFAALADRQDWRVKIILEP